MVCENRSARRCCSTPPDDYQREAYIPQRDIYIKKDASINKKIDWLRLLATGALVSRRDVVVIASAHRSSFDLPDGATSRGMASTIEPVCLLRIAVDDFQQYNSRIAIHSLCEA